MGVVRGVREVGEEEEEGLRVKGAVASIGLLASLARRDSWRLDLRFNCPCSRISKRMCSSSGSGLGSWGIICSGALGRERR